MDLLPTGSDRLLEIRTTYVDLVIKSKGRRPQCEGASSLRVVGLDIKQISVPVLEITENYTQHEGVAVHEYSVAPLFFEQTDYEVTVRAKAEEQIEFRSNSSLLEERISRFIDDDPSLLSGIINFGNNVGFADLKIVGNSGCLLSVTIEVYPSKISYKEDYQEMITDINNMVNASILDFMRKTYQVFVPDYNRNDVPAVFFTIIQSIFDKYMQAVKRVVAFPHHKLITEHEVTLHYKTVKTDLKSEKWLIKHPEYLRKKDKRFQAEKILAVRKRTTFDTQENRLVKFMLQSTMRKIDDFTLRYKRSRQKPDESIINSARRMSLEIQRLLSRSFLTKVSDFNIAKSMSLVFGMAPGYKELYKYYLMLQNGISFSGDVFHISVRDTAQLYEYWCFIKLYDILRKHYTLNSPDIIKVDRKGVTVDLMKGRSSKAVFLNTKTGERIFLSYNPSEAATQTVNQRPDNVLELEKRGANFTYKYVFDAKYRIEMNTDGWFYPDTKPGPKVDDINTMHRYRDSIVYENPESRFTFEKTMFGAYILFPYDNEEEYKDHRFYKSIEKVNIGGLPFLPSATKLVTALLEELITDSSESAFERTVLPVGIEEHLKSVDWNKREVLIGMVSDQKAMEHYLKDKVFITHKFDVANLPVRYVALYEKGKGISWYGEVIGWNRVIEQKESGISYVTSQNNIFNILEWNSLKKPISISEHGPNPIAYTNYFLLTNSSTYSELLLKNEVEYRFYIELKRRTDETAIVDDENAIAFQIKELKVLVSNTDIYVYIDDRPTQICTIQEFSKHPNAMFRRLQKYLEKEKNNNKSF